jgi:rhamnose transport system substrate-binding protein
MQLTNGRREEYMSHRIWASRRLLAVVAVIAAALAVEACGSTKKSTSQSASTQAAAGGSANPNAQIKKGLNVAFLPKQINNPYFTTADKGGATALTEVGGKGKEVGPTNADASAQVPFISTLTSQKVSAIVISADDPNAVVPALKKAQAAGIKVVSYDADTAPAGRSIFVNQASPEALGRSEVQLIGKQLGYKGQIAVLSATATAANQNAWIGFMKKELQDPKYKDMKLVKVAYGNDDDQKSFSETQGLLQAYPNLKGIISPTTVGIAAAARYLEGSKYKGKVALTGLGTPNQMRKFVKDGTVESFELWDPGKLGYLAGYAAAALASGQISGKQGESFKAGTLGAKTVGANGEVLLGPPTVFDKSNIDQFNF